MKDWGKHVSSIIYADSSAVLALANRKGAGKLGHIHVGSLGVQEKQENELEFRRCWVLHTQLC